MWLKKSLKKMEVIRRMYVWWRKSFWRPVVTLFWLGVARRTYPKTLKRLQAVCKTRKLRVVFIVSELAKWKGQSVYDLMESSSAYEPLVAVIPFGDEICLGRNQMETIISKKLEYFVSKGMRVASAWDAARQCIVGTGELQADLVFYQQPWGELGRLSPKRACCHALTFYFSYYMLNNLELNFEIGQELHRFVFGYIVCSQAVVDIYEKERKGRRLKFAGEFLPLGHPMMDNFYLRKDCVTDRGCVIYAPHWTISYGNYVTVLRYSTFMENGQEILSYAKAHPELKWVFKPHPGLKTALVKSGAMTHEQVDAYFAEWERIGIACYTSDYVDLFLSAKAMITDCGSFLTEFAATGKPIIRLLRNTVTVQPHPCLKKLYATYYTVRSLEEMYKAFDSVLVRNEDPNGEMRRREVKEAGLLDTYAARNIVGYLDRLLEGVR